MLNPPVMRSGEYVYSHYAVLDDAPQSFTSELSMHDGTPWKYGIAAEVTLEGIVPSQDLTRFFIHTGAKDDEIWIPGAVDSPKLQAIGDIVSLVANRYRESELMDKFPNATHHLFGEISRAYTEKNDTEESDEYRDDVPHVDFVPPNMPGWLLFLSDVNPTRGHNGQYAYLGNLHINYRDKDILTDYRFGSGDQWPKPTPGEPGKIMFSEDARTLLHTRTHIEGWRTFMRLFVGPVL